MDDVIRFHGLNASKIAGKAQQLKERGDLRGNQIWNDVSREIERLTVIRRHLKLENDDYKR
jgi:hypothetical protein